jgi:hypothetical protein
MARSGGTLTKFIGIGSVGLSLQLGSAITNTGRSGKDARVETPSVPHGMTRGRDRLGVEHEK